MRDTLNAPNHSLKIIRANWATDSLNAVTVNQDDSVLHGIHLFVGSFGMNELNDDFVRTKPSAKVIQIRYLRK